MYDTHETHDVVREHCSPRSSTTAQWQCKHPNSAAERVERRAVQPPHDQRVSPVLRLARTYSSFPHHAVGNPHSTQFEDELGCWCTRAM